MVTQKRVTADFEFLPSRMVVRFGDGGGFVFTVLQRTGGDLFQGNDRTRLNDGVFPRNIENIVAGSMLYDSCAIVSTKIVAISNAVQSWFQATKPHSPDRLKVDRRHMVLDQNVENVQERLLRVVDVVVSMASGEGS
jgi:hypothetical protein